MSRSAFLVLKALGLIFAILIGIGTAVLGWYDAADWINIVFYSTATAALILWGWYHFSIRWIHSDLKQNIFSQVIKKEQIDKKEIIEEEEDEKNFFYNNFIQYRWAIGGLLLLIAIFIFVSFIVDGFFSGRTLVSFLIFLGFIILASFIGRYITGQKSVFIGICVLIGLFIIGFSILGWLTLGWLNGNWIGDRPVFFLGILFLILSAQFFSIGLLGDIMVKLFGQNRNRVLEFVQRNKK